ncbi:helix-turn-helix domain-containing protein [Peribacillus sp. SI8-4]|uniref:helix-turn-helix domain-containing protein n=1 Tax=Peribacillus sp. SI8-4 TaxID=3048009 RepID=UPI0025572587|nr:helix-turn-helix domain-containing protein [Peribacillus sp. SI8-4]
MASHSLTSAFQHSESNLYYEYENGFGIAIVAREHLPSIKDFAKEQPHLSQLIHSYYLECMLSKEKHIRKKLMESIRDISFLEDLDALLTKILENALSVITAADMGVLWMYDEKEEILMPKAWAGGPTEEIRKMQMKEGEGIIGRTFKENRSIFLTSLEDIVQESSSITRKNLEHLQNSYQPDTLQAIISVPIVVEGKTLCVLIIYQHGQTSLLTTQDQELLESFSDQVSIALTNSRLFQHLKEQNRMLIKRDEIHDTFMKLSLQSKGLLAIAKELSRMVNLKIAIVDFTANQLYSNPAYWNDPFSVMKQITDSKAPAYQTMEISGQKQTYYLHPINAINTILGMLIIDVNEAELPPLTKVIFEQSSTVIALEMLRKQTLTDSFYKKINDRFQELLLLKDHSLLCQKATELGIDHDSYYVVTIIQLKFNTDIQFMNMQVHRLVSDVKKTFQQQAPVVFGFQDKITVLCQFPKHFDSTDLKNRLSLLQSNWQFANEASLQIAIGSCTGDLESISVSYAEAEKTMAFLQSRQLTGIMHYQDIGINRLFLHQSKEELSAFIDEVFLPLQVEQDRNHMLEETLLVYIRNDRSASITAKQLHIHVNTLYQRIKKIEEKLHLSLSTPEDLLKIQLACFLKQQT